MGSTCDEGMYAFSDKLQSHLLDDEAFFYIIDFNDMASSSKSYQSSKINNWKQSGDHSINVKRFVKEHQFHEEDQQHQTISKLGPYIFETLSIEANNDLANHWLHPYVRKSSNILKKPAESPMDLRPNSIFLPVKGSMYVLLK